MPTIIKIKTYMCPTGLNNANSECRFHKRIDTWQEGDLCPKCKLELVLATHPEDQCTVTIRDESDFNHPDLIKHEGNFKLKAEADTHDLGMLNNHIQKKNESLFIERSARGEVHIPLTEKDNHGWVAPERKELSKKERDQVKAKIRADIEKFKKLEYK